MKKILVIAPHADDEVLGCGGYLLSEIKKGAKAKVIFTSIGGKDKRQKLEERMNEVRNVSNFVGYDYVIYKLNKDAEMDQEPMRDFVSFIDNVIMEFRPDEVFTCYPSRHQDHVFTYQSTMASMRLKEGYMPSLFALYEYPFISQQEKVNGSPLYVNIENVVNEKEFAFLLYKSQVKESPSPLNSDGILTLAKMRGLECGMEYAEMFYVQSIIRR